LGFEIQDGYVFVLEGRINAYKEARAKKKIGETSTNLHKMQWSLEKNKLLHCEKRFSIWGAADKW